MKDQNLMEKDDKSLEQLYINITEINEVFYWCDRLNCNQNDLVNSIHFIGKNAKMVDLVLRINKCKNNL